MSYEDGDTITINGTDASGEDADWYLVAEYATKRLIKPDTISGSKIVFEELSTQILLKVDSIETNGIDKVRNCRKELVVYINSILEEN